MASLALSNCRAAHGAAMSTPQALRMAATNNDGVAKPNPRTLPTTKPTTRLSPEHRRTRTPLVEASVEPHVTPIERGDVGANDGPVSKFSAEADDQYVQARAQLT